MIHTRKIINLYNKIDEDLMEQAGIEVHIPSLEYMDEGVIERIIIDSEDFNNTVEVNKYDSNWSPNLHNMDLRVEISIRHPYLLFGNNGVTSAKNKIGLGVLFYSRDSNFRKNMTFGSLGYQSEEHTAEFSYVFSPGMLRGNIAFEFFMYLDDVNETLTKHASEKGMLLSNGNIHYLELVVDGVGSDFPIIEIEDVDGPLWQLESNWIDAKEDIFEEGSVCIKLNKLHPLFTQIAKGKQRVQRAYMGDILVQAMAYIIQQVIIIEENDINDEPLISNSILSIVQYWIETFEVNVTSINTISNSLKEYWDRKMIGE